MVIAFSLVAGYVCFLLVYYMIGQADHWLIHNIIMTPAVLTLRVPLMSIVFVIVWIGELFGTLANDYGHVLPAFRRKTDPKGWAK